MNEVSKLRNKLSSFYINNPYIGKPIFLGARVFYRLKFFIENIYLKVRYWNKFGKISFNKVSWISPDQVQYFLINRLFFSWKIHFRIMEGKWDLTKKLIKELFILNNLKNHFLENKSWQETEIFTRIPSLRKGKNIWTFKNEAERDKSLDEIDNLYKKIKSEGYKSQKKLMSLKKWCFQLKWKPIRDEIVLAIDRNGKLIFINGKHRIAIAKILDINRIPIIFLIRHKKWMDFRKTLLHYINTQQNRKLCFKIEHPDLEDIPFKYNDVILKIIEKHITPNRGNLLEIGDSLGYFSKVFSKKNFECSIWEKSTIKRYILFKLNHIYGQAYKIIPKSIKDYREKLEVKYDIVIVFNSFQKTQKYENHHYDLLDFLSKISITELFIIYEENSKFSKEQYMNLYKESTSLKNIQIIGDINRKTFLYKLSN